MFLQKQLKYTPVHQDFFTKPCGIICLKSVEHGLKTHRNLHGGRGYALPTRTQEKVSRKMCSRVYKFATSSPIWGPDVYRLDVSV